MKRALLFFAFLCCAGGQPLKSQPHSAGSYPQGLYIVHDLAAYRQAAALDSTMALADLAVAVPGLVLDIRYATPHNFTGRPVYRQARAFARLPVAQALAAVQQELRQQGLGLKLFDAYRPYAVTVQFWKITADKRYVASPRKGSRHNRGCAVDVTLVDLATGNELSMPTGYDDFSAKAHSKYRRLPAEALRNREALKAAMLRHGFTVFPSEWWHYDFKGWEKYPLLDLPFEVLP